MEEVIIIPAIFIGLPWVILHYITKWKQAKTLTGEDEQLLDELYDTARRLENRIIGIDSNPYLAIAASLIAGYKGMADAIEPREAVTGEIEDEGQMLPRSLFDAIAMFEEATEMRELLGEEFCAVFGALKKAEFSEFQREISPWEREHLLLNV